MVLLVLGEEDGTVDRSELDDTDVDVSVTVCDSILDAPVKLCGANASTK